MGASNINTFYNSTWHKYSLPTQTWKNNLPSYNLLIPNMYSGILLPKATYNANVVNPFNNLLIPPYELSWLADNPYSYTNYNRNDNNSYMYDYEDIYSNIESAKDGVGMDGSTLTNGIAGGLNALSTGLNALSKDTQTEHGKYLAPITSTLSKLPGVAGLVGSVANLGVSLQNAAVGSKLNDTNVKLMEAAINNRARQQFGDNSTTDALIAGSMSNVDLGNPDVKFYGDEGFLNKLRGVGKTYGKKWAFDRQIANANQLAHNTEALAYKDYLNKMIRRYLSLPFAMGGFIGNRYAEGGGIHTPFTHGSLFDTGFVKINSGGSHEQNPNEGIQYGIDPYGVPNMVELGETVFEDYVFSDRIKFPKKYKNEFNLGGKLKGKTFADVSKILFKEYEERPNDKRSLDTAYAMGERLANLQELVKAKQALDQMDPRIIMALLQQMQMQGLQPGEMPVEEQQPQRIMAACGGKLHGYGGNLFAIGGSTNDLLTQLLQPQYGVNIDNYINNPENFKFYRGRSTGRRNTTTARNKGSNHIFIDGNKVTSLPESAVLHSDLFLKAISEYIKEQKSLYDTAVTNKDYDKAKDIAENLIKNTYLINSSYANAYRADSNNKEGYISALQKFFNDLGLNKYVNNFLTDSKRVFVGNRQYAEDNPLDYKDGVVTLNRYLNFTDEDIKALESMGLRAGNLYDIMKDAEMEYTPLQDTEHDILKNLQGLWYNGFQHELLIPNSKYKEGGDEPQYIAPYENLKKFAPEDTEDLSKWWDDLSIKQLQEILDKAGYSSSERIRTGPFSYQTIYSNSNDKQSSTESELQLILNDEQKGKQYYLTPKPRVNWQSTAAMLTALRDDLMALLGSSKNFAPGTDAAYDYISRVGNVPVVRSTPTGTLMSYKPTDLNYNLNNIRNDMFGVMRNANNLNAGNSIANDIAVLNTGYDQMGKARLQDTEENLKNLQFVLTNNNQVLLKNAEASLAAQSANAQNAARAREVQALLAAQTAGTLALAYNNYVTNKTAQSSGLALILYDQGYNNQVLNLRDAAWLLYNQHEDPADVLGIPYQRKAINPYVSIPEYTAVKGK